MSGFLTDLVRRQEKPKEAVRPRLPSLFEADAAPALPHAKSGDAMTELTVEETAPSVEQPARAAQASAQRALQAPAAAGEERETPQPAFTPARQQTAPAQPMQSLEQSVEREAQPATVSPRRTPSIEPVAAEAPVFAQPPSLAMQPTVERRVTRLAPVVEETEIVESPRVTTTRAVASQTEAREPAPAIRPVPPPPVLESPQAVASPFAPPPQTRQQARETPRKQSERTQAASEPTIHVTIGRIEIRAGEERAPTPRAKDTRSSVMTLDEYLKSRSKR